MWKLIELDEALKIMNSHEERLMWLDNGVIMMLRNDINSLPQIEGVWEIEKMIECTEEKKKNVKMDDYTIWFLHWLKATKELLQKFKS